MIMYYVVVVFVVFFFKQKTAYEIVSGDWSSDVCSSDLGGGGEGRCRRAGARREERRGARRRTGAGTRVRGARAQQLRFEDHQHRRCDADPSQRLPAAEATPGLTRTLWRDTPVPS